MCITSGKEIFMSLLTPPEWALRVSSSNIVLGLSLSSIRMHSSLPNMPRTRADRNTVQDRQRQSGEKTREGSDATDRLAKTYLSEDLPRASCAM